MSKQLRGSPRQETFIQKKKEEKQNKKQTNKQNAIS